MKASRYTGKKLTSARASKILARVPGPDTTHELRSDTFDNPGAAVAGARERAAGGSLR